ncbi:hypothetical protein HDEF_1475 [Candidatus Hamiltonella defensa 5AT (Acyrthosiphon pisum)]|uniref:Uncharacterized protein n=1 Tax=Hamiltonella defensa subsp. Acyrthosiphon pisum (strain 5AT) TaxID=572265 RepID=C4K6A6_HAMD5|nr:hypothetical protein HDEF_1475 [Candidatus Hamiltonella defensa 5AT (Acyrthosiphon pisum)]
MKGFSVVLVCTYQEYFYLSFFQIEEMQVYFVKKSFIIDHKKGDIKGDE